MSYILKDPAGNQYFTISGGVINPTPLDPASEIGWIEITNESPYLLIFQAGSLQFPVPAWTGYPIQSPSNTGFPLPMSLTPVLLGTAANAPSSVCVVTVYNMQETPVQRIPYGLVRQANIGNGLNVTSTTGLKNDGNGPGTQIFESTPSDQGSSAFNLSNDGSGLWQVLSAGVQRIVTQITRGNATTGKASIVIGDPGDTSITTLHGTADLATVATNATNVGVAENGSRLTVGDSSGTMLDLKPTSGAPRGLTINTRDSGGALHQVVSVPDIGTSSIWTPIISFANKIAQVGGQNTAGNLGVPVIAASITVPLVNSTTLQTIAAFTPPASTAGMYRISAYVLVNNGTSGQLLTLQVTWPDTGISTKTMPISLLDTSGVAHLANGANSIVNGAYAAASLLIYAFNSNGAITVQYRDPSGTPADQVSVVIERIS